MGLLKPSLISSTLILFVNFECLDMNFKVPSMVYFCVSVSRWVKNQIILCICFTLPFHTLNFVKQTDAMDHMADMAQGPEDTSLLTWQQNHRSRMIWNDNVS